MLSHPANDPYYRLAARVNENSPRISNCIRYGTQSLSTSEIRRLVDRHFVSPLISSCLSGIVVINGS